MKVYIGIIVALLLLGAGVFVGYKIFAAHPPATVVTSQTVVDALHEEGFLVTENYIFNQKVTIKNDSGSVWKDFFWGQDITALATMKVSSGVDLTKLSFDDVKIDRTTIAVTLPPIEDQSVEVVGDITLQNRQGILKHIFNNDDGYNQAYSALKTEALQSAESNDLRQAAEQSAQKQIEHILKLIIKNKEVVTSFK